MAKKIVTESQVTIRFAYLCMEVSQTHYRYEAKLSNDSRRNRRVFLLRLTETRKHWRFRLCFLYLCNVKGFHWHHQLVYRIYRELELNLRIEPRRRIKRDYPGQLSEPTVIIRSGRWAL